MITTSHAALVDRDTVASKLLNLQRIDGQGRSRTILRDLLFGNLLANDNTRLLTLTALSSGKMLGPYEVQSPLGGRPNDLCTS